jgi:hypothetical protein
MDRTAKEVRFIEGFAAQLKREQTALSGLDSQWENIEKTAKAQRSRIGKNLTMVNNLLDILQGKK